MDKVLLFSILLVFIGALVGSVVQHRRVDRVLKDLRGFHVTMRITGKRVWGKFNLFSNALELIFSRTYTNRRKNKLTSFIVFSEQTSDIEAIFRFHDELTPSNQARRLKEIHHITNPSLLRRFKRTIRNFMVAFREAIDESIGLLMSRIKKTASTSMLASQGVYLKKIGSGTLSMVSTSAYDPVMEHYINRRVVFECGKLDGQQIEYAGVLKEYSTAWVSILDCYINSENNLPLGDASRLMMQRKMDFAIRVEQTDPGSQRVKYTLEIINRDNQNLTISHIEAAETFQYKIDKLLKPGASLKMVLENLPSDSLAAIDYAELPFMLMLVAPERQKDKQMTEEELENMDYPALPTLNLVFDTHRQVDIYIPRNKGVLRHGGEFIK